VPARVTLNSQALCDANSLILARPIDARYNPKKPLVNPARRSEINAAESHKFHTVVQPSTKSELHGHAIRLSPNHVHSVSPFLPGLIQWAQAPLPVAELQDR
jgi:hypothetical protein